ncbi:piggyBac transposable element-derived protein 3-like [Cyprinodon tularosa]|uniref:piggyBac transposable element-derived protein 3-like n=1 Tax=Cyprinodon tularosa TaxID=77115 RepID=UPI0018E1ED30|nr:piggyBac transposable element-derived protein 3-like [Cyprinodon tularosa]
MSAAIGEIPETVKDEDKECKTEHNILEADVKEVVIVKEEVPVDYRPYAHLNDPKPEHIKEEQEEIYVSLGGEQLNAKEEMEATSFPVTASLNDGVNDNHSPRLSQLYPDQFTGREIPDGSIYLKTEDTMEDEDNNIKPSVSELKHCGLKTKDMDNDWKYRAPELDGNTKKPYSSSMFAEHFFLPFVQNDSIDSDIESSSFQNEGSQREVQPELKLSYEDCGKLLTGTRGLNRHKKLHTGRKPYTCDVLPCIMASRRRLYSVQEVLEMVCIPNGALSDTESISDDKIADPDFVETPKAYESDSSFDEDEPLADIARNYPNQLDVEIHHAHVDSDIEAPDDNEPQPGPAPVKIEFSWKQRKPPAADIDSSFQGPAFSTPPDKIPSPRWYFDQFMDKSVFEHISHQSNLYAYMKSGSELKTTSAEMEQFIGLHILMTIVRMPSYRMYWQTATRYDPIATVMGRKRFDHLRAYIHMNDNTNIKQKGEPGYDPLFKVRPVLEKVRANCLKVEPEENHTIDEQMIPFTGRIGMKQYLKNKPQKWGIKVYTRAGVSGLVYDFEVYTGKGTVTNERGLGVAGEVVLRLVSEVPKGLNYRCYFNNWFTSPELIVELKKMGIQTVATINRNRLRGCTLKSDKELAKGGRGAYEVKYDMTSGIAVVKWYDKKAVLLASSFTGPDPVDRCRRWLKEKKEYVEVDRPHIVQVYNKFMGGVDLADMYASLYRIDIRTRRWYLRILYYLIDLSLVNGWLLYRRHLTQKQEKKHMSLLDFRAQVADALIKVGKQTDFKSRKRGRPSLEDSPEPHQAEPPPPPLQRIVAPSVDVRLDRVDHFPTHAEKRGRCRLCKDGYTQTACLKCKVLLCFTKTNNCFMDYHTTK